MSFPALTTALLISTAPVNPERAPTAVPAVVEASAAIDQDAAIAGPPATPDEQPPALAPAESTEAPPATESAPSTESVPSTAPTSEPDLGQDDIVVIGHQREATPGDPFEQINAQTFEVVQSVDKAIFGPVALAYKETQPTPDRAG